MRFASDREIVIRAPAGTPGEVVDVRLVFDPGGELVLPRAFAFENRSP